MSSNLSAYEIYKKIHVGSSAWRDIIPSKKHVWFVGRVQIAVKIYLGLISREDLRAELEGLEKATRSPSASIGQLVQGLSVDAQKILADLGSLPVLPDDPSTTELETYYNDIRSRLLRSQRWKPEADKRRKKTDGDIRRKKTKIVGPPKQIGRPSHAKIDTLVGLISGAYVYATGKTPTGYESETKESPLERIVEDVFRNMAIDADYNSKKAVRRHIKRRASLKL
jgi:hypothetical protein